MASCSVLTKAYTVNGNIRDVSVKPSYTDSLLPKPSYGGYLRITDAAGAQKRVHNLKIKDSWVVSAKLGGLLGRKVEEESKTAGTKSSTATDRGTKKLSNQGGTQKLAGTLKLLFGGVDDRPARELPRDDSLVFVAGATGRVGSRAVRELVKLGFKVRAGARNVEKAEEVLADILAEDRQRGIFSLLPLFGGKQKQLEIVEADLESPENLEQAIGAAGKVVCTIGAAENDALNITGPFRIDGKATKNLIRAAKELDVNQFVLVSSLGTTKFGFPASLLNLFWGVLIWKAQAEKELQDSGIAFTIVRPGGMERPKDDYKLTHNLRLAPADSLTGGQVSNLQIAELIGSILANPEIAENKVVEAVAETTAPLRIIEEMLEELPVVGLSQAERLEILRKQAEKAAEEEAEQEALEMQRQDEEKVALEQQRQGEKQAEIRAQLSKELAAAKEKQKTALLEAEEKSSEKAQLEKRKAELKAKAIAAAQTARELRALQEAVLVAAKQGQILSPEEKNAVLAKARSSVEESADAAPKKVTSGLSASKSQLFGGLNPWNRAAEVAKVAEQAVVEEVEVKQEVEITKETEKPKKFPASSVADARAVAEKKVREKLAKQAEAKAQKEAEEKAETDRIETEEAAVKAKLEAEEKEKAKAEEEIKAQAEAKAEAIAKAEAEEKAKVEAEEAAVKAESDAKVKKEEEKRRAVEESVSKAAAKAADKQAIEDERKARSAAQKAKAEQDVKAAKERLAQEAIALALAADASSQPTNTKTSEAPVTASSSTDFPPSPTPLSPYSRYEDLKPPTSPTPSPPGPPAVTDSAGPVIETETPTAITSSTDFPPSPTPLSPYTRYEDLKPPTSPTPKPPGPPPVAPVAPVSPVVSEEVSVLEEQKETPVETTEKPKTGGFRWPWQKAETIAESKQPSSTDFPPSPTSLSPYTRYDDLKPPASPTPNPPVTASTKTAEPAAPAAEVKASSTDFPPSPTPLSPYTRYEDLKPPTSPTPKPPVPVSSKPAVEAVASTEPEVKPSSTDFPPSPTPLSPYTRYPDLKPPTSPTPLPPFPVAKVEEVVNDATPPSPSAPPSPTSPPPAIAEKTNRRKWVAPLSATEEGGSDESTPSSPPKVFRWPWESKSEVSTTEPKPKTVENSSTDLPYANRPLSPYTQFPDLRPPSSPIPYSPDDL